MNDQVTFADIFSRSDLFVGIEGDKLSDIFRFGRHQVYESGITLFLEGDPAFFPILL